MRIVNPLKSPHVWAVIDDGCNSACHGGEWRRNAEEKFARLGFQPFLIEDRSCTFNGIEDSKAKGYWRLPFAVQLVESEMVIPGIQASYEFEDRDHPLLIRIAK